MRNRESGAVPVLPAAGDRGRRRCSGRHKLRQSIARIRPASGDWKILGSAQRRSRGALLQHGSLLLETSPAAPELPGLSDLAGWDFAAEHLELA